MFVLELCACFIEKLTSVAKYMFGTFITAPIISVSESLLLSATLFFFGKIQ